MLRTEEAHRDVSTRLQQIANDITLHPRRLPQNIAKVKSTLEEFEQAPKQLDATLHTYVTTLADSFMLLQTRPSPDPALANDLAELVYVLAKIRGYKFVANFFSNDVYLFPKLVDLLLHESIQQYDCLCYLLLLWLSRLVLVPFPLVSVDPEIDEKVLVVATRFLSIHTNASKTQVVAAVLLALLVARPDCSHLLQKYLHSTLDGWNDYSENAKLGHLMAINQIFKRSSVPEIAAYSNQVHSQIVYFEASKLNATSRGSSIHVLYLIKVASKIAKLHINEADYDGVAAIANYIINDIMGGMADQFDTVLRESAAKNLGRIVQALALKAVNYAQQLVTYMLGHLKIPNLAPSSYLDNLLIDDNNLSVAKYHTVLLFLGFLALSRALPAEFLPSVFSLVHQTVFISQRTHTLVQGSQLRDASCFVLWALLRMINRATFAALYASSPEIVHNLFSDLIRIAIFDEDFTIRRCGVAVLQEFIGRYGAEYFALMLPGANGNEVGAFSLRLVELFDSSAVSTLADSHKIVSQLVSIGIPKQAFVETLLHEAMDENVPFAYRKIGARHLAELLKREELTQDRFSAWRTGDTPDVVSELMQRVNKDLLLLYPLAEFQLAGLLSEKQLQAAMEHFGKATFDHHRDNSIKGESLVRWMNALLLTGVSFDMSLLFAVILAVSRVQSTEGLELEMCTLFGSLSINDDQFHELCRFLKHGNMLLAAAIPRAPLSTVQLGMVVSILLDTGVEADTRALLISKMDGILETHHDNSRLKHAILSLLDDYTLSMQGDVGLKVRFASVKLLLHNKDFATQLGEELRLKLLRLAGESMDKLRVAAFRCLCLLHGLPIDNDTFGRYLSDYPLYFRDYFSLVEDRHAETKEARAREHEAFLRGLVHCAGTSIGVNALINDSFRQVLRHHVRPEQWDEVFGTLLRMLKVPPNTKVSELDQRSQKTLVATLGFIAKIFESGVRFPSSISYQTLYIRAYNLHINTLNVARIGLVVRIFQYVGLEGTAELQRASRKRLCWLACRHPASGVRKIAGDALFEIINELQPQLLAQPLSGHPLGPELVAQLDTGKLGPAQLQQLECAILSI